MNTQDQFTLTFTNESEFFINNTLYSFRTPVNPPIQLPFQQWEVALTKIHIPQTRQNFLPSSVFELEIFLNTKDASPKHIHDFKVTIVIEQEFFKSLDLVLREVELKVREALWRFYEENQHIFVWCEGQDLFTMRLEDKTLHASAINLPGIAYHIQQISKLRVISGIELWKDFGFDHIQINTDYILPLKANHTPIFQEANSTLSLLAPNLVLEQYVGEQKQPLLEMIPYSINRKDNYCIFEQRYPLYKRLLGGYINHIQFELRDVNSIPLYFESGKLLIELHFRPCRPMIRW